MVDSARHCSEKETTSSRLADLLQQGKALLQQKPLRTFKVLWLTLRDTHVRGGSGSRGGQASLSKNVLLIAFSCARVVLLAIAHMLMVHPGTPNSRYGTPRCNGN